MLLAISKQLFKQITNRNSQKTILSCAHFEHLHTENTKYGENFENCIESDLAPIEFPDNTTIEQFVFCNVHKWRSCIALECPISGRKITYNDLQVKYNNLNRQLRKKLKLEKGNTIALFLPNCAVFTIAIFGALKAGLVITTINPSYTTDEISKQLRHSQSKAIITLVELFPIVQKSCVQCQIQIPILTAKNLEQTPLPRGAINFEEFLTECDYFDVESPAFNRDVVILPYSSGTTGMPKGVMLTQRNIISNICQFKSVGFCRTTESPESQEAILSVLPKFHIYGLVASVFYLLHIGCKVVDLPKFAPDSYLKALTTYRCPVLFLAPPLVLFLANSSVVCSEHLQYVRTVLSGAAPLGASDEERFLRKAGPQASTAQLYGLTETSPFVTAMRPDLKRTYKSAVGSIGRPLPNTVLKIAQIDPDEDSDSSLQLSSALGPNEKGELLVKGPQNMLGYYNNPEATKAAFTEDGQWFRTGDMAYYNDDKLVFITDRLKELIKVKGFQVAPAELEEVIRDFPDVQDVAVIGIPHEQFGEVPRAYIVPRTGSKNLNLDDLKKFVAEKVTEYKRLEGGIQVIHTIPRNPSGKILRRQLREIYKNESKKYH